MLTFLSRSRLLISAMCARYPVSLKCLGPPSLKTSKCVASAMNVFAGFKNRSPVTRDDSCQIVALLHRQEVIVVMPFNRSMRCTIHNNGEHLGLEALVAVLLVEVLHNESAGRIVYKIFHCAVVSIPLCLCDPYMLLQKGNTSSLLFRPFSFGGGVSARVHPIPDIWGKSQGCFQSAHSCCGCRVFSDEIIVGQRSNPFVDALRKEPVLFLYKHVSVHETTRNRFPLLYGAMASRMCLASSTASGLTLCASFFWLDPEADAHKCRGVK